MRTAGPSPPQPGGGGGGGARAPPSPDRQQQRERIGGLAGDDEAAAARETYAALARATAPIELRDAEAALARQLVSGALTRALTRARDASAEAEASYSALSPTGAAYYGGPCNGLACTMYTVLFILVLLTSAYSDL